MPYTLIGKDFTPPDVRPKVTGKAKYAEDFKADGMLFCKLLLSPMPHARVRNIDTAAALKMPGVAAVLTADDVPTLPVPEMPHAILTNEPLHVGDPILAIAAVDETTAADALDKIKIDLEPLPYTLDPLESLYPGGADARKEGNVGNVRHDVQTVKWTARDFAAAAEGQLPMGKPAQEWAYGDIDAGFAEAKLVLDESFVTAGVAHHSMEPRSCLAYWQNGKCFIHGSTQSQSFVMGTLSKLVGVSVDEIVYIAEYCGGGFGSKGDAYPAMAIPAHMAKKTGKPVMLRVTRAEEYYFGMARHGFQGRIKLGFRADGRISVADIYLVQENGAYAGFWDYQSAGDAVSIVYSPPAMRWRAIPVFTNTPSRRAQRGPGQNQIASVVEPLLDKAAKSLGIDRLQIRLRNAPTKDTRYSGQQKSLTSVYLREALQRGATEFDWAKKSQLSGSRNGAKVIGVGVGQAYHSAGANGFDGLVRITTDGKLHIHCGVGNLGTYSHSATSRVAAEVLKYDWEHCVIDRGDSSRHLPWTFGQFGSNTSFTMTRTNYVAALDAVNKLKEIAAMELGGAAEDYDIGGETVFAKSAPDTSLTYAAAAQRAIELAGKFSGVEMPENLNPMTKKSVQALAGTGLIGVAKDTLEKTGTVPAFGAAFIRIELDVETGKFEILDYHAVADCGTVIHPQSLATQIKGGAVMGFGQAVMERHVYDPQNGLPANVGFNTCKPPSYLDVPATMTTSAVELPDPQNPIGAKGIGEPVQGCAAGALLCAISDALGGHYFNRVPVLPDMIVNAASGRAQSHKPLQVNTV